MTGAHAVLWLLENGINVLCAWFQAFWNILSPFVVFLSEYMLDWKRLVVKLQEEMIHGQANLPSVRLKKTLFYPGEISEWFKSQSGAAMQGFLPAGNSLQCRYKGVTGCNEQRIKLGGFRKEIKCRFLVKITKNSLWILLLKIFKSRLAFFPPEDIQAQPSVRMLVEETNHCIFRMNRTRAGVYLAFLYTRSDNFLSGSFMHTYYICADRITVAHVEYKMFILLTA